MINNQLCFWSASFIAVWFTIHRDLKLECLVTMCNVGASNHRAFEPLLIIEQLIFGIWYFIILRFYYFCAIYLLLNFVVYIHISHLRRHYCASFRLHSTVAACDASRCCHLNFRFVCLFVVMLVST